MVEHYLDKEVWKDIPGFEGEYQASTFGRIRSLDTMKEYINFNGKCCRYFKPGRVLKPYKNVGKYLTVTLYKDGVEEFCFVHRLVAMTFLENQKGFKSVSFIDGNKYNTKLDNLKWGRVSKKDKLSITL